MPSGFSAARSLYTAMTLDVVTGLFVLMLSTFIGLDVIRRVSRLLHTPLMSLTNAISAIAVVGSILIAGERESGFTTILGTVAVAASMTNIVSGFLITDRMLKMFREKERGPKASTAQPQASTGSGRAR
jgi:proton-translocating NAD(P)+ transhydrogenase subunit alpha